MTLASAAQQLLPAKPKLATIVCREVVACQQADAVWSGGYAEQRGFELVYRAPASVAEPDFTAELGGVTHPLTFTRDQPAQPRVCWFNVRMASGAFTAPAGARHSCDQCSALAWLECLQFPTHSERAVSTSAQARLPRSRLVLPVFVFGVGLGGLFLLPNHLLDAGSAALWYGLVGLGVYLPMAVLRELPLNAAGLAGLSAYLFAAVGGAGGRGVTQPDLSGWLNTNRAVFLITGVICLAVSVAVWSVKRTLAAFVNGTPPPVPQFGVIWSVIFLAIPLASGMRTVSAVWLVAALFAAVPILLESHRINPHFLSGRHPAARPPLGPGPDRRHRPPAPPTRGPRPGRRTAPGPIEAAGHPAAELPRRPSRLLVGAGIGVSFGGVRAVDDVDVRVAPGQRVAIMGSNGAGKTTLLNALCGYVPMSQGTVTLGDTDLTGRPAYARARSGLGRSFQLPRLADMLTVRQSLECGHGYSRALDGRVHQLMERFWVDAVADVPVEMLSFGYRRRPEIVRALVPCPEVLLLDEPVGGLEDEEVAELVQVILDLQAAEGWGLLVIEHNLDFVRAVTPDHLVVMQNGALVTEGPIGQVWDDPRVRRIYLGEQVPIQAAGPI